MGGPRDHNVERLLAESLMDWRASGEGWFDSAGRFVEQFAPLTRRPDALRLIGRMKELGFAFEDRRVAIDEGDSVVLVSFFKGSEVYSALAESESAAIANAAVRYVMRRAGRTPSTMEVPARVETREGVGE